MSMDLYWRPDVPPKGFFLPDSLRFRCRDKWGFPVHVRITKYGSEVEYLKGIRDMMTDEEEIKEVDALLDAVERLADDGHEAILLYEDE